MRFLYLLAAIVIIAGVAVAQQPETDFPVGPQYLVTQPYPTILQPIETPSYNAWQQTGVVSPQTGEAGPVMITIPAYLPWVYWGYAPPGEVMMAPQTAAEQASERAPSNLPANYVDTGVTAFATPSWLESHDYGMSLAQAARYWQQHKLHATHVYTNQDIERLQGQ